MSQLQHISLDALSALKDVMEDDFVFLVETFIQDSQVRLQTLSHLQEHPDVDADAVRRAAHSFKGSCSNLGAAHLAALCAQLEAKAHAQDLQSFVEDLAQINAEFLIVKQLMLEFIA